MKKTIILLILGITITLSFTGCNNSKDKIIKKASELETAVFIKKLNENAINTKDTYEGNIYKLTGLVSEINEKYILIDSKFKIYLTKNDIKKIQENQQIEVAGKLTNIKKENIIGELKNAYLLNDSFTITGEVNIPTRKHLVNFIDYTGVQPSRTYYADYTDDEWYMEIGKYKIKSADTKNFYNEGDTIILGQKIENKKTITVIGKIYGTEVKEISSIKIN